MPFFSNFIEGLFIPFQAIRVIFSNRKVFLLCLIPIIISIAVYFLLWGQVLAPIRDWVETAFRDWLVGVLGSQHYTDLQHAAQVVVRWLVEIFFFIAMILSFAWVSNVVALPINDFVAKATEQALTPPLSREESGGFGREIALMWIDFKKNVLALIGLIICISVGWVPVMNVFALAGGWFFITYQYVSYSQTRRGIGALSAAKILFVNPGLTFGFGITISFALTIPFVSMFTPAVAVVGGTLVFAAIERGRLQA